MKLKRARIVNYRSIADLTLDFHHGCQALIGINESGKSNILRALHLLDPALQPSKDDLRIERTNESIVTAGKVQFEFELDDSEVTEVVTQIVPLFAPGSSTKGLMLYGGKAMHLAAFCAQNRRVRYEVAVPSGDRATRLAPPSADFTQMENWYVNIGEQMTLHGEPEHTDRVIPASSIVHVTGSVSPTSNLVSLPQDHISGLVEKAAATVFLERAPRCVLWKYSDSEILPSEVNIEEFARNPNTCAPLRSMFELAGYSAATLAQEIPEWRRGSMSRYIQKLDRIAEIATDHIRNVWKDHPGTTIALRANGEHVVPIVKDDKLALNMQSRSDGFKRLVSFLLQISARVRTNELQNVLILVDEPEIGLHPKGARDLMDELVTIGKTNTVVYSTHSIFMVDKTNVPAHVIVERKEETTTARRAVKSRLHDEEVLYAAVGYSIFESLRPKNVIFEGWRDKELFRLGVQQYSTRDVATASEIASIGATYADGAKDIKHVAKFLELVQRKCLIISDADAAGRQQRNEYEKQRGWGTWVTLADVITKEGIETGEDLFLREALIARANIFRSTIDGLPELTAAAWGQSAKASMPVLKKWVALAKLPQHTFEMKMSELKDALYRDLKREELSDDVDQLVQFVVNHQFAS